MSFAGAVLVLMAWGALLMVAAALVDYRRDVE
jgi:hypothetical protein